jgi:hypothetical protein
MSAGRTDVSLGDESGHVQFHVVPQFAGDEEAPSPEALMESVATEAAAGAAEESWDEPHAIVRAVVSAHKLFDAQVSPYYRLMRRFWSGRSPADFAPVYVLGWLGVLILLLAATPLWRGAVVVMPILVAGIAAFRWLDAVLFEVGVILDRRQDLLAGYERSLVLAVLNLLELSIIGAIWLLALGSDGSVGRIWLHTFSLTTLTGTPEYGDGWQALAQALTQVGGMVFLAGAIAILLGVIGERFREGRSESYTPQSSLAPPPDRQDL